VRVGSATRGGNRTFHRTPTTSECCIIAAVQKIKKQLSILKAMRLRRIAPLHFRSSINPPLASPVISLRSGDAEREGLMKSGKVKRLGGWCQAGVGAVVPFVTALLPASPSPHSSTTRLERTVESSNCPPPPPRLPLLVKALRGLVRRQGSTAEGRRGG
jgi:hypothetical protein